ncbi:hypothetical protein BCR44DRAFT_1231530 [Catenaria anguillulae PL171]|uniref:Uncharacterized protein n=1 Tax=Catenaria anguillulae PL171 TaxID=765915 RepID=A0A1Y2HDQ3_9FUNG|nr:hypothetical protein BCR44DRAFT_1231530 [Catenaria anguillulae PL171]
MAKTRRHKKPAPSASSSPSPPPAAPAPPAWTQWDWAQDQEHASKIKGRRNTPSPTSNRKALPANPPVPRPLRLLTLPRTVLAKLLSRRFMPRTALVQLACASKAAADVALPELYSTLLVGSFWALPRLCTTLESRPDLAARVHSFVAGARFILPHHVGHVIDTLGTCTLHAESAITAMRQARALGIGSSEKYPRHKLLMPWLVHVASVCPNLINVDLAGVTTYLEALARPLMFGLLELADILRKRRGRFAMRPAAPFSCVLVENFWMALPMTYKIDVFFVTAMDWGKRTMDVTCQPTLKPELDDTDTIVPFRDLLGELADEDHLWTFDNVQLATAHRMGEFIPALQLYRGHVFQWLKDPQRLWTCAGLDRTRDHMFDLSNKAKPVIKGTVTPYVHFIELAEGILRSVQVDPDRQCKTLMLDGPELEDGPDAPVDSDFITSYKAMFARLSDDPLAWVTEFCIDIAFFIDYNTAHGLVTCMAQGLPSLTSLTIRKTNCPLDYILYLLDPLLRRDCPGKKRIRHLTLSANVFSHVRYYAQLSTTSRIPLPPLTGDRSSICMTRATHGHLQSLSLELEGPGMHNLDTGKLRPPTIAIHPGLVHSLTDISLKQVQVYILPARLAQPHSPSFLPIARVCEGETTLFARTLLPLNHLVYLPRVRSLCMTSNCALASTLAAATHFHGLLPRTPNLDSLTFSVDPAHNNAQHSIWSIESIGHALLTYPCLEYAALNGITRDTRMNMAVVTLGVLGVYPREARLCPRLLYLMVNGKLLDHHQLEWERDRKAGGVVQVREGQLRETMVERGTVAELD